MLLFRVLGSQAAEWRKRYIPQIFVTLKQQQQNQTNKQKRQRKQNKSKTRQNHETPYMKTTEAVSKNYTVVAYVLLNCYSGPLYPFQSFFNCLP